MPGPTRRSKIAVLLVAVLFSGRLALAASGRGEISLDLSGTWKIAFDPKNIGLKQGWHQTPPANLREIRVPSCFEESRDGAGYDGVAWYFHRFTIPQEFAGRALYIEFDAVNYACRAWLNGKAVGSHTGGYHRFRFPVATAARVGKENDLVVRVVDPGRIPTDGLALRSIPHGKESWYFNFGGIYGRVRLLGKPAAWIDDVFVTADPSSGKVRAQIEIHKVGATPAETNLKIAIATERRSNRPVASLSKKIRLERGINRVAVDMEVADPHPWSPSDPFLYRMTVELGDLSRKSFRFGFRSFTIENGNFVLNGKAIFVKAVLYQPYYPRTLAYPPSESFVADELRRMKRLGFNMVRIHAAVAPPTLLDRADEIGLMVLEEPSVGWVYGSLDQIAEPCLEEVAAMVRRDRNHPSIVAWGTISQGGGDLAGIGDLLARRALQLDPTRPVFGNWPSRWAEPTDRACLVYLPDRAEPLPIAGGQIFIGPPIGDDEEQRLRTLGTSPSLVFISALGCGGMSNIERVLGEFGGRDFLEDYRFYRRQRDRAVRLFSRYNLNELCGSLSRACDIAQQIQMETLKRMVEVVRSNPNVDGYCISQWRDAAWESGPGIVDIWGKSKRREDLVARMNRPVLVVIDHQPRATRQGDSLSVAATIVNDAAVSGKCRLELKVRRADGRTLATRRSELLLSPDRRVVRVEPVVWRMGGRSGRCTIYASLYDRSGRKISENERTFVHVAADDQTLARYDLLAIDPGPRLRLRLTASGIRLLAPPAWPRSKVALVSARGPTWRERRKFQALADVLERIDREGGTLLLDCSSGIDPAVERVRLLAAETRPARGGFLGRFAISASNPLIGLSETVMPRCALWPHSSRQWQPQIAMFDSYGRFAGHIVAVRRWGAGRIVAFTQPLFDRLDKEPEARLLCSRLLGWCSNHPRHAQSGRLKAETLIARFEGGGDVATDLWWICGPFGCKNLGEGLRRVYPPERKFDPGRSYTGKGDRPVHWKRYRSDEAGHVDFADALGGHENAAGYAFTYFYSRRQGETTLHIGSDDAVKVFLNGELVLEKEIDRSAAPDQDRTVVKVRNGWNELLVKIINASGEWHGYVSLDLPVVWSLEKKLPAN